MKKWYRQERNTELALGFKKAKKDIEGRIISQEYQSENWLFVKYLMMQPYVAEKQNTIWVDPQHRYVEVHKDLVEVRQKTYHKNIDEWKDGPKNKVPREVIDHLNKAQVVKDRGIKFEIIPGKAKPKTKQETNS